MVFKVDRRWTSAEADSVLSLYGMNALSYQRLISDYDLGALAENGWYIKRYNRKNILLKKQFINTWAKYEDLNQVLWGTEVETGNKFSNKIFGANIGGQSLFAELNDSTTRFILKGFNEAEKICISGTFNNWSTEGVSMIKSSDGWYADITLLPGRHEYKFINDGKWFYDPANTLKIADGFYSFNNVYFKPNYRFTYAGEAKKVIVSGSFNNWNERDLVMVNDRGQHHLDCFLPDGDWQYRFIVDGTWVNDASNPRTVPNDFDGTNSLLSIGKLEDAEVVFRSREKLANLKIAGSFNGWNEVGSDMIQVDDSTWRYPLQLRSGIYTYRFISSGKWITDPSVPTVSSSVQGERDNVLVVGSNYSFQLKRYATAKKVYVTGSFIEWSEPGIEMVRRGDTWVLPYFLGSGKVTYKFIVDGEWILDPENPIYEDNEFGTNNSVIWIP